MEIKKVGTRLVPKEKASWAHIYHFGIRRPGNPPKYKSPHQMEKGIIHYFESLTDEEGRLTDVPTITGLALHLGFASISAIPDYMEKEEYRYLLERARTVIENFHEKALTTKQSPIGAIFALKNLGWKNEGGGAITINSNGPLTIKTQLAWDD